MRLSETDALGVVYYGQYYTYFDLARLEMLRKVGLTLPFLRRRGLGFVAAESSCRYRSSAVFDDLLTFEVGVANVGNASVTYSHIVKKGRERLAVGKVVDVMVDKAGRPVKIPGDIRKRLLRYPA